MSAKRHRGATLVGSSSHHENADDDFVDDPNVGMDEVPQDRSSDAPDVGLTAKYYLHHRQVRCIAQTLLKSLC
nr:hypothetical protein Itr_chr14CG09670 [Ipomoea trifida]